MKWIAILTIIIALVGGIPGIISIINHFRNRPVFTFSIENVITGMMMMPDREKNPCMLFLTGTVSNEGDKPLSPAYYELQVRLEKNWLRFEKWLIPEDAKFKSEFQDIDVENPSRKDLQRFSGTISFGIPVHGHLMFLADEVEVESLRNDPNLTLKLTCVDVFGKRHVTEIPYDLRRISPGRHYPKHGLTVTPKKPK